jgi:hypothetical protein
MGRQDISGRKAECVDGLGAESLAISTLNGETALMEHTSFDILTFTTHTEDFDNYFMQKLDVRSKQAPRPSQHLPKPLPALLDAIEKTGFWVSPSSGIN